MSLNRLIHNRAKGIQITGKTLLAYCPVVSESKNTMKHTSLCEYEIKTKASHAGCFCDCHQEPKKGNERRKFYQQGYEEGKQYALDTIAEGMGWENGTLTYDILKSILAVCNVKINLVQTEESFLVSFVPKNVTGKAWKELKEKIIQIIKK